MKRICTLLFCLFLLSELANAQRVLIEYNLGYGTFGMSDLKGLLQESNPLQGMKVTDNFPGYATHELKAGIENGRISYGVLFGYQNTAGQKALADYSGEYKDIIRVKGYKTGIFSRYQLSKGSSSLSLFAQLSLGSIFSKAKIVSELSLPSQDIYKEEKVDLKGINIFVQPTIILQYALFKEAALQAYAGYEWSPSKSALKYEGNKTNSKADWDGLRIGMGIVTYFRFK